MTYIAQNGTVFDKAFTAVQYAMNSGVKIGIYKNGKFLRWLV